MNLLATAGIICLLIGAVKAFGWFVTGVVAVVLAFLIESVI